MVFRTDIPLFVICTAPLWSIYLLRCCINRCIAVNVCDKECVKFPCALCWTPVVGRRLQSLPSVFYCIPGEVFYCLCVVKVFYVVRGPGVNANRAVWGGELFFCIVVVGGGGGGIAVVTGLAFCADSAKMHLITRLIDFDTVEYFQPCPRPEQLWWRWISGLGIYARLRRAVSLLFCSSVRYI